MPPALQTTSRNQCAPLFLEAGKSPNRRCVASQSPTRRKEIPCAVNLAAARVADAGAESVRQLGRHRCFELRRLFRRLATLRFLLSKALARLSLPGLLHRKPAPGSLEFHPTDFSRGGS